MHLISVRDIIFNANMHFSQAEKERVTKGETYLTYLNK